MASSDEQTTQLESPRLGYRRLISDLLDDFHELVVDEYIRRFLLDGEEMDREWCCEQLRASDVLFDALGIGLWLVFRHGLRSPIGLSGFVRLPETGPEPQLLYALRAAHTGKGYATEIARALVAHAKRVTSLSVLLSAVDEPNTASTRVLEKVGFEPAGSRPGAFGRILEFRLHLDRSLPVD